MATRSLPASSTVIHHHHHHQFGFNAALKSKPNSNSVCFSVLTQQTKLQRKGNHGLRKKNGFNMMNICMVRTNESENDIVVTSNNKVTLSRVEEKLARKQSERTTYLLAAMLSTLGISSMAVLSVYYRFSLQMESGEIPLLEMFGTFALAVGAATGMEYWARWAHRALWHASLWHMHESHHRPRDGPFELNDVFAIINAVPAIALLAYGFLNKGFLPGLCFGAVSFFFFFFFFLISLFSPLVKVGLGITVFGMAYMFVHDGLVHRRFPVGTIAHVPYLRKVAAAHQLHHADKFDGVPYGLFLGPQASPLIELEEVGGLEELEKEIKRRTKLSKIL
ncbi:Fatty acid hydroxylase [Corchorus olitorius]|uniref:beta-carotene 3-hydroxylase n=1 Tax=Corchorus olitorius TaxID=93759 RepID=A0A1R3KG39_9ROSI|nr:Fatty acid hydroxylase [Corchorus olitorius]